MRVDDETISDALHGGCGSWLPWSVTGSLFRNSSVARCLKYLPQGNFLPPKMTLRRIFEYYAVDYAELAEAFPQFAQYQDAYVRELSSGEVRIAGIWIVLCSPAPFCILDEPFSFLAPVAVERIQDLIRRQPKASSSPITTTTPSSKSPTKSSCSPTVMSIRSGTAATWCGTATAAESLQEF